MVAIVVIGTAISEIQVRQYDECGSTTVGCVKNYKTQTALECTRTLNSMLHVNKKWRLCEKDNDNSRVLETVFKRNRYQA